MYKATPDEILNKINLDSSKRGKLKIFFGASAGVGKTYAMLGAGHERLKDGIDVVAGIIETHNRVETQKLLTGLPTIPDLEVNHRGIKIKEFDLDTCKARHPQIVLIDELAHSNAPGSRHSKRWQDIEELLNDGIDVYTTLNVQHIESLNNLVEEITGVSVSETVPDLIFDNADDVVIVDITSDELIKRLKEGKVYIEDQAKNRAINNFFKKNNIVALRELALRRTAERVDAELDHNVYGNRTMINEKIMVCIGPNALSAKLVRSAKRIALGLKAPWVVVYVENSRNYNLNAKAKKLLESVMGMAERIGGKTVILHGDNAVDEIISYARNNKITKIIVGKRNKSPFWDALQGSLADKIIRRSGNIDIYIITGEVVPENNNNDKKELINFKPRIYLQSILAVSLFTIFNKILDVFLVPNDQIMIYLIGAVLVSARLGRGPSIVYSVLSVVCFNFFFVEPLYSFNFYNQSYLITFAVMLVTSIVITAQASRLRLQAVFARNRERNTQTLYDITRAIATTRGHENIAEVVAKQTADLFVMEVVIWLADKEVDGEGDREANIEELEIIYGHPPVSDAKELGVARWCFNNQEVAGYGTNTMSSAAGLYFPLGSAVSKIGVMAIFPRNNLANNQQHKFNSNEISLLKTLANLLASGLERANSANQAEQIKVEIENEKLRNTMLSSISHDLRTPLASIIGSSDSISSMAKNIHHQGITDLSESIQSSAQRLSHTINNLLDVSKLESGTIRLNKQLYFIDELLGSVLLRLKDVLSKHQVVVNVEDGLEMVMIDGMLIEQVLVNLLENACKHTKENSIIKISVNKKDRNLLVVIEDDGPGIKDGDEKKIFDKFYTTDHKSGAGLGLAICQNIINIHHGQIWAENKSPNGSNGGSKFSFTVPINCEN